MTNLHGLRIHIIGLGSLGTGQACARVLAARGAHIAISDCKPASELTEQLAPLQDLPVDLHLGEDAYRDIEHAELIIPSPGVPLTIPPLAQARAAGISIVSEIEVAYWLAPCPIIAITGTKGKTTTTTLIGKLLEAAGRSVLVGGNIGVPLIQQAAAAGPHDLLVAEVSSFQLEITRHFRPKVAVFLNFFADHLDRHSNLDEYWQAKTKLFANQQKSERAIINTDDPALAALAPTLKAEVLPFSLRAPAWADLRDGFLRVHERPVCTIDQIKLRGQHNLYNVLAALAAVAAIGASLEAAPQVLQEFRGVANRLEEVDVINGVTFINDSQATIPDATQVALEAMDAPTVLIAGGRAKVADFSALAGALAAHAKALIVIGEAAKDLEKAARQAGFTAIYRAKTLPQAVRKAYELAVPGEIVLLSPACASFDMFKNMTHRGEVFREAVQHLKKNAVTKQKEAMPQ
jgi:UDP-N-acetylmuramoylalanine--D-glutamate ligase